MSQGKVKPIPEGYHSATPYLVVDGAASALDFYRQVFGATERMRMPAPGGRVGHAADSAAKVQQFFGCGVGFALVLASKQFERQRSVFQRSS